MKLDPTKDNEIWKRKENLIGDTLRRNSYKSCKNRPRLEEESPWSRRAGSRALKWQCSLNNEAKLAGLEWNELMAVSKNRLG